MTARTPPQTRFAILLVTIGVLALLLSPTIRAEPVVGSPDRETRTVTWSMTDPGLRRNDTMLESGNAVLKWVNGTVTWSRPNDFGANGTFDRNLTGGISGIELAADTHNHIADGEFAAPSSWQNLSTGNVSVVREGVRQDAYLGHASNSSSRYVFDSLDTPNDLNWSSTSSSGSTCFNWGWLSPGHNNSGLMIQCIITLGAPPVSEAGIARTAANWSAYDRLLLWVYAENPGSPVGWSFRVSAWDGSTTQYTSLQPLTVGWQEITVDLTELGPNRAGLANVRFLVVGQSISGKQVDFDDIRLSNAKSFDETGRLWQNFTKANATSPSSGSAALAFDYQVAANSGVGSFDFAVNFSGTSGFYLAVIPTTGGGSWGHYSADVSSITSARGQFTVEFAARIVVHTIFASNAAVRIDNVTVEFPNRAGGSFVSNVIDVGSTSEFLSVGWSATMQSQTSIVARIRTGNQNLTTGTIWSPWRTWDTPGSYSSALGLGHFFQIAFDLATTNASRTPILSSAQVSTRHRASIGTVEGTYVIGNSVFQNWKSMSVQATTPLGAEIALFADRGRGWELLGHDGALPQTGSTTVAWSVRFETDNGTMTSRLSSVVVTYLVPLDLAAILQSPYLLGAVVPVVLAYAGYVGLRRRAFALDDVFLISREGRLLMHNTRRMRPDRDEDILSGMLTAILAFLRDSDPEENGELHHFKVGEKTTVLERGEHAYVAAVYSGRVPRWAGKDLRRFTTDLEARFGSAFAHWSGDPEDLQGLKEFTSRFISRPRYRSPRGEVLPSA